MKQGTTKPVGKYFSKTPGLSMMLLLDDSQEKVQEHEVCVIRWFLLRKENLIRLWVQRRNLIWVPTWEKESEDNYITLLVDHLLEHAPAIKAAAAARVPAVEQLSLSESSAAAPASVSSSSSVFDVRTISKELEETLISKSVLKVVLESSID